MQMDVCSHINFPVNDVNNLHGLCMNTLVGNFPVDHELAYKATKFLNIKDDIKGHEKGVLQKPVSAMKGSREKRGVGPAKQLTVKWAPDVYDPVVPCSPALVIVIKRPHKKNGKSSKEKKNNNGGTSSRGSSKGKGKDKKQSRKRGGEIKL